MGHLGRDDQIGFLEMNGEVVSELRELIGQLAHSEEEVIGGLSEDLGLEGSLLEVDL